MESCRLLIICGFLFQQTSQRTDFRTLPDKRVRKSERPVSFVDVAYLYPLFIAIVDFPTLDLFSNLLYLLKLLIGAFLAEI